MAFVVTKVQAYGQEAEEAITKRYRQFLLLDVTANNSDVALDLGSNQGGALGTFWTAVSGTTVGANALRAVQDIVTRAEAFGRWGGNWTSRAQADGAINSVVKLSATPQNPGGATATYVVTGLLAADVILGVTARVGSSAIVRLVSYALNEAVVLYLLDPGAGSTVDIAVLRAGVTTVLPGTFQATFANKTPNFLFVTGDAPTAFQVLLEWTLQPSAQPVEFYGEV